MQQPFYVYSLKVVKIVKSKLKQVYIEETCLLYIFTKFSVMLIFDFSKYFPYVT